MAMINNKINKVTAEGDNIFVFQYIDSDRNKTEERKSFEEFLQPFTKSLNDQIKLLNNRLSDQLKTVADKEKIEQLLDEKILDLTGKIQKLEQEKKQLTKQIEDFLSEIKGKELSETTELYQEAFDLFIEGKIDEALEVLDDAKLEESDKIALEDMKLRVETRLLKARILRVKHKYEEAGKNYEKALSLHVSWRNCLDAGMFFMLINDYEKAELYFNKALNEVASLEEKASTLRELANLLSDKKKYKKAEKFYKEAKEIKEKSTSNKTDEYFLDLILTLNNLGNLYLVKEKYKKAEETFKEAYDIFQDLLKINHSGYFRFYTTILSNFANVKLALKKYDEAEMLYSKVLHIQKIIKQSNLKPDTDKIAITLVNLGSLYREKGNHASAEKSFQLSLELFRQLAESNPKTYLIKVGICLVNLSIHYRESMINKELSLKYIDEAISIFSSFSHVPYIDEYLEKIYLTLKGWNINVEEYLKKIQKK